MYVEPFPIPERTNNTMKPTTYAATWPPVGAPGTVTFDHPGSYTVYYEQQGIDATGPFGRAMMQMATVFAELERSMIRSRVMAGLDRVRAEGKKTLGRPAVGMKIEEAIRQQLGLGHGILKVAKIVGCGSGTVQRVKKAMVGQSAETA